MVEDSTRTAIKDATLMVEVAFNIVSYSMSDTSEALTEAHLRDMDDFLIKLFWAYRHTERMYGETSTVIASQTRAIQKKEQHIIASAR